ncbi:MAG: TetR/AcrR family transcriptional regulator [Chloroflexi bacterium]|nr:TetR/AcrR family transcriptional regulator [Chloroflexota bacterium]
MSPRSEEQNEALRERSRAKILDNALALFARFGYERTSVRMIAQAAGVSQGLLYNYFESKDHLLRALFVQSMRDVQETFAAAQSGGSPAERVERLIRSAFDVLKRNRAFWKLSYSVRMQPAVLAGLQADLEAWTASIHETLQRLLAESGAENPAIEAELLFALVDGVSQHYVLAPDRYPVDAVVAAIVAKFRR